MLKMLNNFDATNIIHMCLASNLITFLVIIVHFIDLFDLFFILPVNIHHY